MKLQYRNEVFYCIRTPTQKCFLDIYISPNLQYVVCLNFIHVLLHLQFKTDSKLSKAVLFVFGNVCQKTAERKLLKAIFLKLYLN